MGDDGQFDVAVIGGGPGGYTAAFRAAQLGLNVALVEIFKLGGVCLHAGCIPFKALLENVRVLNLLGDASRYGITANGVAPDFARMMQRKGEVVARLNDGLHALIKKNKVTYFEGMGSLLAPGRVRVRHLQQKTEEEIAAKNVVIATGSKPKFIPAFAADGRKVLFSDHVIELTEVPKSMAILGGGPIGVETATVFSPLGCQTTILEAMPHIMITEEEEIQVELERRLAEQGIEILTGVKVSAADKTESGVSVKFADSQGNERTLEVEKFLVAIGRDGMISGLGLETVGVETERNFIKVNEKMQTSVPGVYAVGDVVSPPLLAHKASAEGVVAAETIAGRHARPLDHDKVPHCTYSEPQVASVGLTERVATERGYDVKVGRFSFKINGKALCEGREEGFVKIVADAKTGEVLGSHMIGHEVTELIMECSEAMYGENTIYELGHAVHAHPTRSEAVKEAALDVTKEAITK